MMVDAMPKKTVPKPSTPKAKKSVDPKRTTKDINAAEKNKGSASREFVAEEEEDAHVLMKLRAHL